MMCFLIALVVGVFGAIIVFISREIESSVKTTIFVVAAFVYTLIGWLVIYFGMPSVAYPTFASLSIILLVWWIISAVVMTIFNDGEAWNHANWFPICFIFVLIVVSLSGWGFFQSDSYTKLIGDINNKKQIHWSQEIAPLDQTKIRLVPHELAISLAKTTLSQDGATLGSQFPLDTAHITLQKIKNDYWYLIPLDYKSWTVWTNASCVPAYVKILATDPFAKPILVTDKKFKYTPDAYFGDNLDRRLYWKYIGKVLVDYSLEEDEEGNVFWIISVCRPSISFWGLVVDGVIVYNAETGEDQYVAKSEIKKGSKYAWIDRVIPLDIINDNINYWGSYKGGWWNQAWNHVNLLKAETPTLNYGADGRCMIVTPITSTNDKDGAMTGLMYTDAQTGESTYYAVSGGASEQLVIEAVNSVVSYKKWHASKQIVYENIYGKLSALIPIMGANGNYQGLAIVENENKRVAIGTTPQEALINYQKVLMSAGGQLTAENIKNTLNYTGIITRLGWEVSSSDAGKQYYLYFKDFRNSFMVTSSLQSELSLTREGDLVSITYIASEQSSVPVMSFRNISLNLTSSKNEQAVNAEMTGRKSGNQIKADVKDFKEGIKNMSDEEIKKLMEKK